jgi:putative thioredoxin
MSDTYLYDVGTADFADKVVARSHEVPVVVDFWAAWCGPCRTLGPLLERAVTARDGDVLLAKVDVDRNQQLAAEHGIRGIPAVKGFHNGEVVAEFVGAVGPAQIEEFLDRLVPSPADRLVVEAIRVGGDDPEEAESLLRRALDEEPAHRGAAVVLAHLLLDRDPEQALELVRPHRPAPDAEKIAARAEFALADGDLEELRRRVASDPADTEARLHLGRALAASGDYGTALDELLEVVRAGDEASEEAREQILAVLRVVGDDDPLAADARKRLASALF